MDNEFKDDYEEESGDSVAAALDPELFCDVEEPS